MSELDDFKYFEENQLVSVDFSTGKVSVKYGMPEQTYLRKGKIFTRKSWYKIVEDVGYKNHDGYLRIRCNGHLRMKHRLIYWLYHHSLPDNMEIDHIDKNRSNNAISNLRLATRSENCKGNHIGRTFKHLPKEQVHALCQDIVSKKHNITQLAKKYNVTRCNIKAVIVKKRWKKISDLYFKESSETIEKQQ